MRKNKDISIKLPDEKDLPVDSSSFFKWLFFFFKPYLKVFSIFLGLRALRYTVLLLLPLVVGLSINAFEDGWAFDDPEKLIVLIGSYMVIYGLALFSMLFMFYESSAQDQMIRAMTLFSIKHMNQLPLSWHENQGSGGKLQRVMTARNAIKQLFNMYKWFLVPFLGSIFAITLSVFIMKAPPWFLLLYLGFMVSYCLVGWIVAKP
jgi:ATP-binding cassette subfamily B protein